MRVSSFVLAACLLADGPSARAVILFVDMNNAPQEYGACMDGAGDDQVQVVSPSTNGGNPVNKDWVERKIKECEANGQQIDSIILSGHDGSGHFFGDGGELYAGQLKAVLDAHPSTKKTAVSMGLIGCYPNTVHGAENFWLRPNQNVKQTFGFPVQSPTKHAADTATLVEAYCRERKEWAAASNNEELCKIFPNIAGLTKQLVSMCTREAVASRGYGAVRGKDKDMCFTYDELRAKCAEFDPGEEKLATYAKYFAADPCDKDFENPPLDKNAFYASGSSDLRDYYNQVHLWRHCTDQLKADRGYEMPFAPKVIRLIKYNQIKTNLARLNARELADYDQRLKDLCLDEFALGDITKLSRSEMNRRIDGAVRALDSSHGRRGGSPVAAVDAERSAELADLVPLEIESILDGGRAPAAAFLMPRGAGTSSAPDQDAAPVPAPRPRPVPAPRVVAPSSAPVPNPAPAPRSSPAPSLAPAARPSPTPSPAPARRRESAAAKPRCETPVGPPPRICRGRTNTQPETVEIMAKMMKTTFVDLNYYAKPRGEYRTCSHFKLVEDNAPQKYKSMCVVGYAEAARL